MENAGQVHQGGASPIPAPDVKALMASLAEEIGYALANPVTEGVPPDVFEHPLDPEDLAEAEQIAAEIPGKYPELMSEIEQFNSTVESAPPAVAPPGVPQAKPDSVHDLMAQWVSEATAELEPEANTGPIDDDEIAALFASAHGAVPVVDSTATAGALTEADILGSLQPASAEPAPTAAPAAEDDGHMTADDIAALFAQADQLAEEPAAKPAPPVDEGSTLTVEDVANLLASPTQNYSTSTPDSSTMMSDEEIAALLQAADKEERTPTPRASAVAATPVEATSAPADKPQAAPQPSRTFSGQIDRTLADRVSLERAVAALALPTSVEQGRLVCLVAEPFDHEALAWLSQSLGLLIETHATDADTVVAGLRELYADADRVRLEQAVLRCSRASRGIVEWAVDQFRRVA